MPLRFEYELNTSPTTPSLPLVDIGNDDFRFGQIGLTQNADLGEPAVSTLRADDPTGSLSYVGLRRFQVYETSAPSNNQLVYSGRLARRTIRRSKERGFLTAAAREWEIELADQSVLLGWRYMMAESANRPAETASTRLNWLIDTRRVPVYAHPTYCSAPSTQMDAADYRMQRYVDVLASIANVTNYNFWCDWDEGRARTELFFLNPNSTDYASSIQISNDLADVDQVVTFPPSMDAELSRDPTRVGASFLVPYGGSGGYVYETLDATGDEFAYIDQVAPDGNVKTAAKASALATRLLNTFNEEDDSITVAIDVPAAQVNDVRHGQTINAKFTHLPGYESFVLMRVRRRSVIQTEELGQDWYRILLDLSPTGTTVASCSTAIAAMTSDVASGTHFDSGGVAAVSSTVSGDGYLVGILIGENGNTPSATNMGSPSGYTELYAESAFSRATWYIGYKAASAGSHTMSASYTNGFGAHSVWVAAQAWLPWASFTVVQEATGATSGTLASPPTVGNTILMFGMDDSLEDYTPGRYLGPTTGWTRLFNDEESYNNSSIQVSCWARCVSEGDGLTYDWTGDVAGLMTPGTYVVEIATS